VKRAEDGELTTYEHDILFVYTAWPCLKMILGVRLHLSQITFSQIEGIVETESFYVKREANRKISGEKKMYSVKRGWSASSAHSFIFIVIAPETDLENTDRILQISVGPGEP
jgi:hypothetical protein